MYERFPHASFMLTRAPMCLLTFPTQISVHATDWEAKYKVQIATKVSPSWKLPCMSFGTNSYSFSLARSVVSISLRVPTVTGAHVDPYALRGAM